MSDQKDSQVANEDTNASQAAVSQEAAGETQSGNSLAGAALADALLKDTEARELVRRQLQSEKDKGVSRAEKKADQVQDQLEAFAQAVGIDLTKVKEYRREKLLEELYQERYSAPNDGDQQGQEAQTPASSVDLDLLKQALPHLDEKFWNSDEVLKARDAESVLKLAAKPKPQATTTQLPGGGSPITSDKEESLMSAYKQELTELKKANRGVAPPIALSTLKEKYRQQGLKDLW